MARKANETRETGLVKQDVQSRTAPIDMTAEQFRAAGHSLVDRIADFLDSLPDRPVTPAQPPSAFSNLLKTESALPETGTDPEKLLDETATLLIDNSLFNGHPRFWGYITSSPAPIGMLGDLLGAAVNPNVGAWKLSPMATEMERQTIRWIAELIGYAPNCGGALVSGGNMANFVCFLAARTSRAAWSIREQGLRAEAAEPLSFYASRETHTWIQKAADLFGHGTDEIRWISVDADQRLNVEELRDAISDDKSSGRHPFLVVGSAGTVSTGAVDPLDSLADICSDHGLWFHVDGAYGGFAAAAPSAAGLFRGMDRADSIAVDPHKWLYAPLEAGCALVRDRETLRSAFAYHPPYYHFGEEAHNFVDYSMQNSRGFRALKVWLALKQVGRQGYVQLIEDDILLARALYDRLPSYAELERLSHNLSITALRYVPGDLTARLDEPQVAEYANKLNSETLIALERSGEAFLSNAVIDGVFAMRLCVVNFRTTMADIQALPELIIRLGREQDQNLRPASL